MSYAALGRMDGQVFNPALLQHFWGNSEPFSKLSGSILEADAIFKARGVADKENLKKRSATASHSPGSATPGSKELRSFFWPMNPEPLTLGVPTLLV